MKKLKDYIERKKIDKRFKQLGQAHTLSDSSSSSNVNSSVPPEALAADARARAAEAVERRLNQGKPGMNYSQKAVYMKAKRELEEEQRRLQEQNAISDTTALAAYSTKNETSENESIRFTCDLLDGVVLPKSQMYQALENFLVAQLNDEPIDAAILMIYSLNSDSKVKAVVPTIQKYLENIINNPEEIKFRRIRMSNKVFLEKVVPVKGAVELLNAVGFVQDDSRNETTNEIESFLVMIEPNVELLSNTVAELLSSNPVGIKLYRDIKVYCIDPSKPIPRPTIPPDFYSLSGAELKSMQEARSKEVEKLSTLRTSKMREQDAIASGNTSSNYKYTIIRIRFPNNYVLEATFNVYESVFAVREFVSNQLDFDQGIFVLTVPSGGRCVLDDKKSLLESGLVPTALIHFDWSDETLQHFTSQSCRPPYLNQELEKTAKPLV